MEQLAENIGTIGGIVLGIAIIAALIFGLILAIIYDIKTTEMRKELISKMDEHDKSVIMTYKNTQWTISKKKNGKSKE